MIQSKGDFPATPDMHRKLKRLWKQQTGSALMATLVVATMLGVLGLVFMSKTAYEKTHSGHNRRGIQAFYVAEAATSHGLHLLQQEQIQDFPHQLTHIPFGSGEYDVTIDKQTSVGGAYATDFYTITGIGDVADLKRGVEMGVKQDTFLRFARFVENSSLSYAANAVLTGEVWAGGNLNLNGTPVTFLRDVSVGGHINYPERGIFHGSVTEDAPPINLQTSVDLAYYRDLAQGYIVDAGAGLYSGSSASIDLSLFDFSGNVPSYNGSSLSADFNGVVYVDGDAYVWGTLVGGSVTVIASDDIVIAGSVKAGNQRTQYVRQNPPITFNSTQGLEQMATVDITPLVGEGSREVCLRVSGKKWNQVWGFVYDETGRELGRTPALVRQPGSPDEQMISFGCADFSPTQHSYTAELHFISAGNGANPTWVCVYEGEPSNVGLVAKDKVYISSDTPRQLVVDAALLARDNSWQALGDSSSHPSVGNGSWVLTINGPIITGSGGSAGPWSSYGTRHYNYDEDIVEYPPPHFPVPFGGWQKVYWREIPPKDIS